MKKKAIIGWILMVSGVFLSTSVFAQGLADDNDNIISVVNPGLFVAILGGVIMALGFQMILTNLSVAVGLTAIGNVRSKKTKKENTDAGKDKTPLSVKLISMGGVWAMITAAISLFFASLFAVKLSLLPYNGVGLALGLIIWAIFSGTMLFVESKGIGSMVSGLFGGILSAIKSGYSGIGALFGKSESAKSEAMVDHTVDKIKNEVSGMVDHSDLKAKIEEYVNKLQPRELNTEKLKNELADFLSQIKLEQKEGVIPGVKEIFLKVASAEPRFSKHEVSTFDKIFDIAKTTLKVAGTVGGVSGLAGLGAGIFAKNKSGKMREEVEAYLHKNDSHLSGEILQAELDEIFNNETNVQNLIKCNAGCFDKEYVAAQVAQQKGISREHTLGVADEVEKAINAVLRKFNIVEMAESKAVEVKDKILHAVSDKKDQIMHFIEEKIRSFLSRVDRPELNYDMLKKEFEMIIDNPKLAPHILKMKLKQLDSDTLKAIIASGDKFSKEDAERMLNEFEESKFNMLQKFDEAKEYALDQAEKTRKAAMVASWWLLGTLVVSAIASVAGGMVAL